MPVEEFQNLYRNLAPVGKAIADVGAIPTRLARGYVTGTVLEGDVRVVTFANGMVARERIVTLDHDARRLAYASAGGRLDHHNASFQVLAEGPGRCRVVWITDLLPDAMADAVTAMVDGGVAAIRATLAARG